MGFENIICYINIENRENSEKRRHIERSASMFRSRLRMFAYPNPIHVIIDLRYRVLK